MITVDFCSINEYFLVILLDLEEQIRLDHNRSTLEEKLILQFADFFKDFLLTTRASN